MISVSVLFTLIRTIEVTFKLSATLSASLLLLTSNTFQPHEIKLVRYLQKAILNNTTTFKQVYKMFNCCDVKRVGVDGKHATSRK